MHYTDAAGDCIWTGGRDIVRKAEKIGIVAALCGIALLFLIASTDLVLEEDRKEVYTIAFITDGSADDRFLSLRRGMEKAAKKWNVDLVTDAPYISGNAKEQETLIKEAVENGAQAVILVPADQEQMKQFLDRSNVQVPVIALEKEIPSEKQYGAYTYDSEDAARKLARAVLEDTEEKTVTLYAVDASAKETANCLAVLEKELEDGGCQVVRRQYRPGSAVEEDLVVAADPYTFSQIVNLPRLPGQIYGIGFSNKMLTLLETGNVRAAVVGNEYDKGYLSVEAAMKSIRKGTGQGTVKMEQVLVRPENMYEKEYEALLFPVS